MVGNAHRPQVDVAVGQREPKNVLVGPQQDRIVDDSSVRSGDEYVLALSHLALGEVAGHEHVREGERVRA